MQTVFEALGGARARDDDARGLQRVDHGEYDRFTLFRGDSTCRRRADAQSVIPLAHRAQVQLGHDLGQMLAAGLVTPGVKLEHDRIDADLVGDRIQDGSRDRLARAQRPPEIAHQRQLHRKA